MRNIPLKKLIFLEFNKVIKPNKVRFIKQLFGLQDKDIKLQYRYTKAFIKGFPRYSQVSSLTGPISFTNDNSIYNYKKFNIIFNDIVNTFKKPLNIEKINALSVYFTDRLWSSHIEMGIIFATLFYAFDSAVRKLAHDGILITCSNPRCREIFLRNKTNHVYCSEQCRKSFKNRAYYNKHKMALQKKCRLHIKEARGKGMYSRKSHKVLYAQYLKYKNDPNIFHNKLMSRRRLLPY